MKLFEERTYRSQFNSKRFKGFEVAYLETDLWIGVDAGSYHPEMEKMAFGKIKKLRNVFDEFIQEDPFFRKSLKPYIPGEPAPIQAIEMAKAAEIAGIGPMSAIAGLFAREAGDEILRNFSVNELVIENGGDIFALLKEELVISVFAGESVLSERIGLVIPGTGKKTGICTSAGTVGPSLSFGKADAVVVVSHDILVADALATALGNKVKSPSDVERVIRLSEKIPEIESLLIICDDKVGIRGDYEVKIIK